MAGRAAASCPSGPSVPVMQQSPRGVGRAHGSQEEGAGSSSSSCWPSREDGWDSHLGKGSPHRRRAGLQYQPDKRTVGGATAAPGAAGGVPHPLCISTAISISTKLASPGSGVSPVPMQCGPSPPCRSWPGVLGVARLRHD